MSFNIPDENLAALREHSAEYSEIEDFYFYSHLRPVSAKVDSRRWDMPIKVGGVTVMLIKSGRLDLEVNMNSYTATADSLIVLGSNSLVKLNSENWADLEAYLIFLTPRFLHDINVNVTAIYIPELVDKRSPILELTHDETVLLTQYFSLLNQTASGKVNEQLDRNIASSLLSATVYQLVQFQYKRIYHQPAVGGPQSRRLTYVHDFLKLVHANYLTERRVSFYAAKLCITNKYLSVIVRECTGRSPGQWIDEFVGMEAKSLLRYSGKNIQQVAYTLNFPNQASFGKFFKNLTGMTPSQYQKS